ncbi:hypothetical protein RM531_09870 [Salinisphaera sp. P385]|uniref:DUF4412 domain-containing protein n=1 Tax=Spectribacter acetivorans TaxID=3075603 RepID=A0ABU3B969_9GAMM|nr:hypothetical protein [Salinisphaera sp. P385]MDT0618779.1 hypothetical protein [Salinisphaera sp. P385]
MASKVYLTAVLALVAATAAADVTLVYDEGDDPFKLRVRAGEIRIDDGSDSWQLYRRADNAIYSVNPDRNRYTRMDEDAAARIRDRIRTLRERMETRLAELPAAEREIARAALADQVPGFGASPEVDVTATDTREEIAGRACTVFQVRRGGKAEDQLCVASRDALGMTADEFDTVAVMFELMQTLLAGTGMEYVGLPYLELDGVPIRYQDGREGRRRTLSRVSHDTIPGLMFEIPPHYEAASPQLESGR